MPKPRERDPNDKIKGLAGKPPQKEARRQMTAKLRKALAHRNRDGAEVSAEAQATDQTEQAAIGAVEEVAQSLHGAAEQSFYHKRRKRADLGLIHVLEGHRLRRLPPEPSQARRVNLRLTGTQTPRLLLCLLLRNG